MRVRPARKARAAAMLLLRRSVHKEAAAARALQRTRDVNGGFRSALTYACVICKVHASSSERTRSTKKERPSWHAPCAVYGVRDVRADKQEPGVILRRAVSIDIMETQFRVTSAAPCSGAMLRAFRKRFRVAFGRDSEIRPEREFLQAAEMCWADRPAASVRLRTLLETIESEGSASKESVQDGLTAWMELCNATAALLDSAPELPPERFNEMLADLGAAIGAEYGEEGFRHLVWDAIVSAMDRFLDENRLSIMDKDRDERLARRVDVFFPESGRPLSQEILGLLAFRILKQDRSMISLPADEIFAWLMTFSRDMNYVRQRRLLIRARMGKNPRPVRL